VAGKVTAGMAESNERFMNKSSVASNTRISYGTSFTFYTGERNGIKRKHDINRARVLCRRVERRAMGYTHIHAHIRIHTHACHVTW